jgi:hypothetical protein
VTRILGWFGAAMAAIGLLLVSGTPVSATASPRARAADAPRVLHRVVWDESLRGRNGVHLWAAHTDGSHAHRIYTSHRGFTTGLVLDRRGRRVAFAPCCRADLPRLVVARVTGGRVWKPLTRHPEFSFVSGIGWSPHGTRLVFEGNTGGPGHLAAGLWTVRLDGTRLHRLLELPPPGTDESPLNEALAWTRQGVLYCDRGALRVARHGHEHVLVRRAYSVHISGDGRHIVTEHYNSASARSSIWYGDVDGTDQRRLWRSPHGPTAYALLRDPVPDFHGRRLLIERVSDPSSAGDGIAFWHLGADATDAPLMDFLSQAFAYTWN